MEGGGWDVEKGWLSLSLFVDYCRFAGCCGMTLVPRNDNQSCRCMVVPGSGYDSDQWPIVSAGFLFWRKLGARQWLAKEPKEGQVKVQNSERRPQPISTRWPTTAQLDDLDRCPTPRVSKSLIYSDFSWIFEKHLQLEKLTNGLLATGVEAMQPACHHFQVFASVLCNVSQL